MVSNSTLYHIYNLILRYSFIYRILLLRYSFYITLYSLLLLLLPSKHPVYCKCHTAAQHIHTAHPNTFLLPS